MTTISSERARPIARLAAGGRSGAAWLVGLVLAFSALYVPLYRSVPLNDSDVAVVVHWGLQYAGRDGAQQSSFLFDQGRSISSPAILGTLAQALPYLWMGETESIVRFTSLLWVLLAGVTLRWWLLSRGCRHIVANLAALCMLVEPLAHLSARHGRVDSLAIAVVFGALAICNWGLRMTGRARLSRVLLAGGLAASSVAIWPTSVLFVPLVLGELFIQTRDEQVAERARVFAWAVVGVTIAATGLASILLYRNAHLMEDLAIIGSLESHFGFKPGALRLVAELCLQFTPVLVVAAAAGVTVARNRPAVLLAIGAAALLAVMTQIYEMRVLYLLPYAYLVLAQVPGATEDASPQRRRLAVCALVAIFLWGWTQTWAIAAVDVARNKASYDYARVVQVADAVDAAGCNTVLDYANEFYFEARRRGWRSASGMMINTVAGREPKWMLSGFDTETDFVKVLALRLGACAILVPDPNDWLVRDGWTLDVGSLHDSGYCELSIPGGSRRIEMPAALEGLRHGENRGYGPYRVFLKNNLNSRLCAGT